MRSTPNGNQLLPYSLRDGYVIKSGRSVQCCTCFKLVYARFSRLSFLKFKALESSHSWRFPHCCVFAVSGGPQPSNTMTFFGPPARIPSLLKLAHLDPSVNEVIPLHSCLQTSYPPSAYILTLLSAHFSLSYIFGCSSTPSASSFNSFRFLQWNAGSIRARSVELLHFISLHPVALSCIQESNLGLSSPFQDTPLCDLIALTSGMSFFLLMTCTPAVVLLFSSGRIYPSLNCLPPFFLSLSLFA